MIGRLVVLTGDLDMIGKALRSFGIILLGMVAGALLGAVMMSPKDAKAQTQDIEVLAEGEWLYLRAICRKPDTIHDILTSGSIEEQNRLGSLAVQTGACLLSSVPRQLQVKSLVREFVVGNDLVRIYLMLTPSTETKWYAFIVHKGAAT